MEKRGNIDPSYTPEVEADTVGHKQASQSSPEQRLAENHVQSRLVEATRSTKPINVNRK